MTTATVDQRAAARARVLVVLAWLVASATTVANAVFSWPVHEREDIGLVLAVLVLASMFLVPGSMITLRQPRNTVGPALMLVGVLFGFLALSGGPETALIRDDWRLWVTLLTGGAWAPPIFTLLTVIPLIFPDGTLPSPRWRWVIWAGALGSLTTVIGAPFEPVAVEPIVNPIANETLYDVLSAGTFVALLAIVLAMGGMVGRYRRARGLEREQMKIFAFAAVVAVSAMVLNGVLIGIIGESEISPLVEAGLLLFSAAVLSVGIAFAILRHKLFDIDLVISKTLVYGTLAVLLTGIYLLGIVAIGGLAFVADDQGNPVVPVAATALAALAFQPLRTRAQRLANRLVYGKRSSPYEVLSRLSEQVRETRASEDILQQMAVSMAQATGASTARVWIRRGDVLWAAASFPPSPDLVETPADTPAFRDETLVVRVEHADEELGALTIRKPPNDPLTATEERLLRDLGAQAGLVLRNARLTSELLARLDELKASRQRLVKAQDEERRRIERDLHDGAQQMLVALKVQAGLASQITTDDNVRPMLRQIVEQTGEALETLRDLARGIYPPLLASDGLGAALRSQAGKAAIPTEVDTGSIGRYRPEAEAAIYFCCLEAMQNAAKYSQARAVQVRLFEQDAALCFEVSDDGAGFDPATAREGSGTTNMRDRLAALDGVLQIHSEPGRGTRVRGSIPLTTAGRAATTTEV